MTDSAPDLEHDLVDALAPDDVDGLTAFVQYHAGRIATARLLLVDRAEVEVQYPTVPEYLTDGGTDPEGLLTDTRLRDLIDTEVDRLVAGAPDRDAADRALLRMALIDRDVAEVQAFAALRRDQLDQWEEERVRAINSRRAWHEGVALAYAAAMHRADPKKVTDKLPHGEVTCRKAPDTVETTDAEAFGLFAVKGKYDAAVRVKYEPVKAKLDEVFVKVGERLHVRDTEHPEQATDEVVPGVRVVIGTNRPKVSKVHPLPPRL